MLHAAVKSFSLTVWIGCWYAIVWLINLTGRKKARDKAVRLCYAGLLKIIGIRLTVKGEKPQAQGCLLVSNHLSYLDIVVLGSQLPVCFTPKSDVAAWPVIGSICRLCDVVFVDRRPGKVKEWGARLRGVLEEGRMVAVFPEATTGTGIGVKEFKSGFFSAACDPYENGAEVIVQPVAILYRNIRRLPIGVTQWPAIAWYGDMALAPHVWEVLKLGSIHAELHFLPPITASRFEDRKALAKHCREVIVDAMNAAKIE